MLKQKLYDKALREHKKISIKHSLDSILNKEGHIIDII
jgi:ribosomal protein S17